MDALQTDIKGDVATTQALVDLAHGQNKPLFFLLTLSGLTDETLYFY
jgi:hypothetical protein